MSRVILLSLCFFIAFQGHGQPLSSEFIPNDSLAKIETAPKRWETYLITLPGVDRMVYTINDNKFIHHYLLDKSMKVQSEIKYETKYLTYQPSKSDLVASNFSDNKFYYFFRSKKNEIVREELDFSVGLSSFATYLTWSKKDKYLSSFALKNKMYFLTTTNKPNVLRIYADTVATDTELKVDSVMGLFDLDKTAPVAKVESTDGKGVELMDMSNKSKIYLDGSNHLRMTFDDRIHWTIYFDIDLDNSSYVSKVFKKQTSECNEIEVDKERFIKSNSYLLRDKIFQVYYCPEHIFLHIKYIETGQLLKEYHAVRDSAINFTNSELIESTKYDGKPPLFSTTGEKTKDLSTKQFFRKLNSINLVAAEDSDKNIILKLGEAGPLYSSSGGGMIGGGPYGAPIMTPSVQGPKIGVYELFFKSFLDPSLNHIKSSNTETKFDRLDKFKDGVKEMAIASTTFSFNDKLYYAYYMPKEKKYFVAEIQ